MTKEMIQKEINDLNATMLKASQEVNRDGLFRLGCLLLALLFTFASIIEKSSGFAGIAFVWWIAFLVLVKRQNQASKILLESRVRKAHWEKVLRHRNGVFASSSASSPLQEGAYYLEDLDVFGKNSLFDDLNFCQMEASVACLKRRLSQPLKTTKEVLEMQQVFQELHVLPQTITYLCQEAMVSPKQRKMVTKKDLSQLPPMPLYLRLWTIIYLPMLLILLLGYHCYDLGAYWMLLGLMVSGFHFRFWSQGYHLCDQRVALAACFDQLTTIILKTSFQTPYLSQLQKRVEALQHEKKRLETLNQCLKIRHNPLLLLLLNAFCFYDGLLYCCLEKQKEPSSLLELQALLGDFGALCSMSQWLNIKEKTIFPTFDTKLQATALKHPLMESEKAIGATFSFEGGTVIITGSNMAGKTTFMRNIGLNLVLFYLGLSVEAEAFVAPLLEIHTSMRVADRTQEGISTFYGELLRIKAMVKARQQGRACLYLIDEIFKGTNLKDRVIGAKATIAKLDHPHNFLFVSTHDEALCTHETVTIHNIHFEEHYLDNQIAFDYLPKPGIAQTTNAQFLMKMIGLLE